MGHTEDPCEHHLKDVGRNKVGEQGQECRAHESINVIQGYQNPIPGSQHDLFSEASGTPVELCSPTLTPSPPTTKPTSKLPRTHKFCGIAKTATGSDTKAASEHKGHMKEIQDQVRLQPLNDPEQVLAKTFKQLTFDSDDWEKIEGLTSLRSMAQNHKELLLPKLPDICLAVMNEVKNLRSAVSQVAMVTQGGMYIHLQRAMDCEVEVTGHVLLHKASSTNSFIRQGANTALGHMVRHQNAAVRSCAAEHLESLADIMGAARILSGKKDLTDRFLITVSKLATDPAQDVRHHGRSILKNLATHGNFAQMWNKFVQKKEQNSLRDIVSKIKPKAPCLESFQKTGPLSSRVYLPCVPPKSGSPFKKESKDWRKVKTFHVQSNHRFSGDYIKSIDLLEEVEATQAHLTEWKVVKQVEARRNLLSANSMEEEGRSSRGSLSSVDMRTPDELCGYLLLETLVELCIPTLTPSPPTTKPTNKLPRTHKFRGIAETTTGSGQSYPYANTN
ncbi:hypothetical protein DPEC_G00248260 [Dallia pectoralis]|uniref:Uncharacterized protein n=1 Tax=Dallia pectoralis TaxID=75939 RepID=A0ACC2FWZ2_DALPE|nr:hypothetical protein DPEC_G00248260 [Dallia pectoralis]